MPAYRKNGSAPATNQNPRNICLRLTKHIRRHRLPNIPPRKFRRRDQPENVASKNHPKTNARIPTQQRVGVLLHIFHGRFADVRQQRVVGRVFHPQKFFSSATDATASKLTLAAVFENDMRLFPIMRQNKNGRHNAARFSESNAGLLIRRPKLTWPMRRLALHPHQTIGWCGV